MYAVSHTVNINTMLYIHNIQNQMHPDIYKRNKVVRVRISGDGAKYSRNDTFIPITFNILTGKNDLSSKSKSLLIFFSNV